MDVFSNSSLCHRQVHGEVVLLDTKLTVVCCWQHEYGWHSLFLNRFVCCYYSLELL